MRVPNQELNQALVSRRLTLPFPLRYRNWSAFLTAITIMRPVRLVA